jgi:hypothetical protein
MDVYRLLRIFMYAPRMNYHHYVPTSQEQIWFQLRSIRGTAFGRFCGSMVIGFVNQLLTKVPRRPVAPTAIQIAPG